MNENEVRGYFFKHEKGGIQFACLNHHREGCRPITNKEFDDLPCKWFACYKCHARIEKRQEVKQ